MEVAVLTARVEADVAGFQSKMAATNAAMQMVEREVAKLEKCVSGLKKELDKVGVDESKIATSKTRLTSLEKTVNSLRDSLVQAKTAANGVEVPQAQTSSNLRRLKSQTIEAYVLRDAFVETKAASETMGISASQTASDIAKLKAEERGVNSLRNAYLAEAAAEALAASRPRVGKVLPTVRRTLAPYTGKPLFGAGDPSSAEATLAAHRANVTSAASMERVVVDRVGKNTARVMETLDTDLKKAERSLSRLQKKMQIETEETEDLMKAFLELGGAIDSADISASQTAANIAQLRAEESVVNALRDAYIEEAAASRLPKGSGMPGFGGTTVFRGKGGRFTSDPVEGSARWVAAQDLARRQAQGNYRPGGFGGGNIYIGPTGRIVARPGATPMGPATNVGGFTSTGMSGIVPGYQGGAMGGYAMTGVPKDLDELAQTLKRQFHEQRQYESDRRNFERNRDLGSRGARPMGISVFDQHVKGAVVGAMETLAPSRAFEHQTAAGRGGMFAESVAAAQAAAGRRGARPRDPYRALFGAAEAVLRPAVPIVRQARQFGFELNRDPQQIALMNQMNANRAKRGLPPLGFEDIEMGGSGMPPSGGPPGAPSSPLSGGGGGRRGGRRDRMESEGLIRDIISGGGRYNRGGRYNVPGPNILAGILPGGARARPAALAALTGTILSAGPVAAPALAGASLGITAGIGSLIGGFGALKLAFSGITAQAFKTQEAFDKLTPTQQEFVQTLRELDAGFGKTVKGIAQATILPAITRGIRTAASPQMLGTLTRGTQQFSGAVAGGIGEFSRMVGSPRFAKEFGDVIRADSGYLRNMFTGITNLTSAFITLQAAAIPLTDWMSKGIVDLTEWADKSVKASQASGGLAQFMDKVRISMQELGQLAGAIGSLFKAFFSAVGFSNSLALINLVEEAIRDITKLLEDNRDVLHNFFGGALASARDMLHVLNSILQILTPLLAMMDRLVGGMQGWQRVINTIAGLYVAKFILMRAATTRLTTSIGLASTRLTGLGLGLRGIAGKTFYMAVALTLVPPSGVGQDQLDQIGLGWLGHLPVAGGAITQAVGAGANVAAAAMGAAGLNVMPPSDIITNDQQLAWLRKHPGWTQFSNMTETPNDDFFVNKKTGRKRSWAEIAQSMQAAAKGPSAAALQRKEDMKNLPQSILDMGRWINEQVENAKALVSAYGTPEQLEQPGGSLLPPDMQLAIAKAETTKTTKDDVKAIGAAVKNLMGRMKGFSKTDQISAYQEIKSLQDQLDSLTKSVEAPFSGISILPPGLRERVLNAQSHMGALGGVKKTDPFDSEKYRAAIGLVTQLTAAQNYLEKLVKDSTLTDKKKTAVMKEQVVIAKALAAAQKDVGEQLLAKNKESVQAQMLRLAGLGPQPTSVSAQRVVARERSALLSMVRAQSAAQRALLPPGRRRGPADPFAAVPGAANMTIPQLIKGLEHSGVKFTRAAMKDFNRIAQIVDLAKKSGQPIPIEVVNQMNAWLKQIADNTKPGKAAHPTSFHFPSINELMKGLPGTFRQRHAAAQKMMEAIQNQGKIHRGQSAFGFPEITGAAIMAGRSKGPAYAGQIPVAAALLGSDADRGSRHMKDERLPGKIEIHINGYNKDKRELAREVHHELSKSARRNPTQTRGPNAGRNRNLN